MKYKLEVDQFYKDKVYSKKKNFTFWATDIGKQREVKTLNIAIEDVINKCERKEDVKIIN